MGGFISSATIFDKIFSNKYDGSYVYILFEGSVLYLEKIVSLPSNYALKILKQFLNNKLRTSLPSVSTKLCGGYQMDLSD